MNFNFYFSRCDDHNDDSDELPSIEIDNKNLGSLKDFVSIDFETATFNRMACQLGMVLVKDLNIVDCKTFIMQPPQNAYDENCIRVHGITPEQTVGLPTFKDYWPQIKDYFADYPIVAHNAVFDIDVLRKNLLYYSLPDFIPEKIICTCRLHNGRDLLSCCAYYGIQFCHHHEADSDALGAADILIHYIQSGAKGIIDVPKLASTKLSSDVKKQDLSSVKNKNTIFYDKKVVISGVFSSFPNREDLAEKLKSLGADINCSISKRTEILVKGDHVGPKKLEKVEALQQQGYDIRIIEEDELLKLI